MEGKGRFATGVLTSFLAGCGSVNLPSDSNYCESSADCGQGVCEVDLVGQLRVSTYDCVGFEQGGYSYSFNAGDFNSIRLHLSKPQGVSSGTYRVTGEIRTDGVYVGLNGLEEVDCNGLDCVDFWDDKIVGECR
jgi:hypothetical protein